MYLLLRQSWDTNFYFRGKHPRLLLKGCVKKSSNSTLFLRNLPAWIRRASQIFVNYLNSYPKSRIPKEVLDKIALYTRHVRPIWKSNNISTHFSVLSFIFYRQFPNEWFSICRFYELLKFGVFFQIFCFSTKLLKWQNLSNKRSSI